MTETEETIEILNRISMIGGKEDPRWYPDRDRWFIAVFPPNTEVKNPTDMWLVVSKYEGSDKFVYPHGSEEIDGFELLERIAQESKYITARLAEPTK